MSSPKRHTSLALSLLVAAACAKTDTSGLRTAGAAPPAAGAGGETAAESAPVAGAAGAEVAVDDADFATAIAPVSVSGTNLRLAAVRVAVVSTLAVDAQGALVRTEAARVPVAGDRVSLPGLPGDKLLEVAVGDAVACLPALGGARIAVVVDRGTRHGCALLALVGAIAGGLVNDGRADLVALGELGALVADAEKRTGKALDAAALVRLAAEAAAQNAAATAGKDAAAVARAVGAAFAAGHAAALLAAFDAKTYDAAQTAKATSDGGQITSAAKVLSALSADPAALAALSAVAKSFAFVRAAAADPAADRARLRVAVEALTPADLKRQVDGSLAPDAAAKEVQAVASNLEPNTGGDAPATSEASTTTAPATTAPPTTEAPKGGDTGTTGGDTTGSGTTGTGTTGSGTTGSGTSGGTPGDLTLDGFSARSSTLNDGRINVSLDFPADATGFASVKILRVRGDVPPAADCASGTVVHTFTSFADASFEDDTGSAIGEAFSYRACIFGAATGPFGASTVVNIHARDTVLPPDLASFSGDTGNGSGRIVLTFKFPAATDDYAKVTLRRLAGGAAPDLNCQLGTPLEVPAPYNANLDATFTDTNLNPGAIYSYRACVYDRVGNFAASWVTTRTASQTSSHYVFVTSHTYGIAELGSLAAADARCADAAGNSSIVGPKYLSWKAVVGGQTEALRSRVTIVGPVYNIDDTLYAAGSDAFWNEASLDHAALIKFDEHLGAVDADHQYLWSGSTLHGAQYGSTCNDWSSVNGTTSVAYTETVGSSWLNWGTNYCTESHALACISQ